MEQKILNNFIKKMGKQVQELDLFVALNTDEYDNWDKTCEVMETKDNGKVWFVECTKTGNIKSAYQLQ